MVSLGSRSATQRTGNQLDSCEWIDLDGSNPRPGFHNAVRVQGERIYPLGHEPFSEVGVIAGPLAAYPDLFALCFATLDGKADQVFYGLVSFVEAFGNQC